MTRSIPLFALAVLGVTALACGDDTADVVADAAVSADGHLHDATAGDAGRVDSTVAFDGGTSDGGVTVYSCTSIGTGYSDGFFALESFNGKLYAGQFGYGHEAQSMLYRYPPWELTTPGLTGISESVCALKAHGGYLYANTESSGNIYRSPDGSTWELVHDGDDGSIGCGLAELGGVLYAVNYGNAAEEHGRILRQTGSTWDVVYDSGADPLYLREIVAYGSTLYAFGVQDEQPTMLTSTDGASWVAQQVANRYFRAHVWDGALWLGSASLYSGSPTGVWRYDGAQFSSIHPVPTRTHVTDLKDLGGALYASTSNGWKTESGPSSLLRSPDGVTGWRSVCELAETAVWNLAVHDGELYLGTWEYGVGGAVYRLDQTVVQPVDCGAIPLASAAWEVCETGPTFCAGVFDDGAGCAAFCAAAGLPCTARFGGGAGCVKEPQNILSCGDDNGHQSDWCECGTR